MSADNGIYIAKFPEGYRVVHAQAIENVDYYPEGSFERRQELWRYFGGAKVHPTLDDAYAEARELAMEWEYLEYGICEIGDYESFGDDQAFRA